MIDSVSRHPSKGSMSRSEDRGTILWYPNKVLIYRSSDRVLENPVNIKKINEVTRMFAPLYDNHMAQTHLPVQYNALGKAFEAELFGNTIVDLGCGSGRLSSRIATDFFAKITRTVLTGDVSNLKLPSILLCLDISRNMIEKAKVIMDAKMKLLASTCMVETMPPESLHIHSSKNKDIFHFICRTRSGDVELIRVIFVRAHVKDLQHVCQKYNIHPESVIASYIFYWLRGWKEKKEFAKILNSVSPPGAILYSGEEYPLKYGGKIMDKKSPDYKLARGIVEVTTVVPIQEVHKTYIEAGFTPLEIHHSVINIDNDHAHHGMFFRRQ